MIDFMLFDISSISSLKCTVFQNGNVEFTTNFTSTTNSSDLTAEIHFVKRNTVPLNDRNINDILDVHSIRGSPLDDLYNSLRGVWCPSLLKNPEWSKKLSPRLMQLLTELESTLGDSKCDGEDESSLDDVSNILEPKDEINFWAHMREKRHIPFKSLAVEVDRNLQDISNPGFADLEALDFDGLGDLITRTQDALNGIWEAATDGNSYPRKRMQHFFSCIGGAICRQIQKLLGDIDLWHDPAGNVRLKLQAAVNVSKAWVEVPHKLTANYWRGNWKGDAFEDSYTKSFLLRLEEVIRIRSLSEELGELLTPEEKKSFRLTELFKPLASTHPLLYNPYTENIWQRAVSEYEKSIDPVEEAVATRFRRNVAPVLDQPQLLLREFQKYRHLLERPTIRRSMISERETLLSQLKEFIGKIEMSVDTIESSRGDSNDFISTRAVGDAILFSTRVNNIVSLRQLGSKASSALSLCQDLLSDLDGFSNFSNQCKSILSRVKTEENSNFDAWVTRIEDMIEDDLPALRLQGSLMGWKDGVLVVNFSEELVRFLREVRQLDDLGLPIPKTPVGRTKKSIVDKAVEASKYYRYGILLKKTANFYNSISEQMIDVQENLLLASINAFIDIVSKPSLTRDEFNVSWSNPTECENYIKTLQAAAEKLSSENRSLRKVHESLCMQTVALMNIDLLRQTDMWKTKWRGIKEKMNSVKNRYSERDCRSWVLHWDHQIFKSLECSYQMMLESLNEHLPEIKTELIFVHRKLDFKPPLENIRQSYYNEMKKFVAMPNSFEGFGNANVYRRMGVRNSHRLTKVFARAESLFEKLSLVIRKYQPLVRLGQIPDLDGYIEANVVRPDEYTANFKVLKSKRRDIDKMPDSEKIDCCTVSLTPFKGYLDELLLRISDCLLVSLRRSILDEMKEVDAYLTKAADRLSSRPHTVDEITEAQREWKELGEQKDRIRAISHNCVEKKKLLLLHAPGSAVDVSEVLQRMSNLDGEGGRWDDFDIGMEAFNFMIEDQKEEAKSVLEEDVVSLNKDIDKIGSQWRQLKPSGIKSYEMKVVQEVFDSLDEWKKQFEAIQETAAKLTESCLSFDIPKPRFDGLDALIDDLNDTNKSWDLLKEYLSELSVITQQDWIGFSANVYELQDFAMKWFEKLKASSASDSTANYILTSVDKMKKCVPTLKYCNGDTFGDDHWTELLQVKLQLPHDVNKRIVKVEHFLLRIDILIEPTTLTFVKNLQSRAMGEIQIKTSMDELSMWEKTAEICILTTDESGRRIPLIKEWKDLFIQMGDKQSLLSSLKESPFYKAFAVVGDALEVKMSTLDKVLGTLNSIQRKWVYLEPIFGRGALPAEEARFRRVDEDFSDCMSLVNSDPKLFNLADNGIHPNLVDKLRTMLDQLERCQKALAEFLEAKRSAMPRFYFIGDDDLLEILGQAKNPAVIQSHLKKLFQGINKVQMNENNTLITAMVSSANEVVELETPVKINERVEEWLESLACEMRETLAKLLSKCLSSKEFDWKYPSQILCLAQQVNFTDEAEAAIENRDLDSLLKNLTVQLRNFTSIDFAGQPLEQLKMKSLVMDLVHNVDVVQQLKDKSVRAVTEYQWEKQLRYYFEENYAVVRMFNASFSYTYEYQGNAPKLVHTPLTDKCYLTLTQGMHMGFGGNPYGPAGTGKTESVKALAACMGRQVLVFNCDEGIDFQSMGRIFIGLVKCGAWGCFDEFNRLKEDQLSAISQQIQVIQDAIKMRETPINLLGRSIDVNFNAGIFVTLNPAGKGYGGRSRLPDNLKALFRPVAMGRPDNELIAEVNLVTEGFTQSKDLASKIVSLFSLSKQLLSSQQHYDWGLRALKAVLNTGGRLIQSHKSQGDDISVQMEYEILIKAVRVNTLSKLTFSDTNKFLALIGDVFPGVPSADISGGELEEAIRTVMREKPFYLVEDAGQVKKMMQLKESLDQRMGCVIVGPSGCGKSTLWRVLKAALIKCGQAVITHVMNPKSMPRERLLGHMDLDTREWADGVLTDAARKVVIEPPEVNSWIICDGDVDPEWIESLNSVLDDNHLLTLPNGERISFGPNVNFLFETHDLKFASPATVSRMGMIFLSDEDLDVNRLVQKWLSKIPQDVRSSMSSWIDEMFFKGLDFVTRCECIVDTTLVGTVMNGLSQIKDTRSRNEFICGLIRGIGGNISFSQRITLAKEVFQWGGERPPDLGAPLDCKADGASIESFVAPRGDYNDEIGVSDVGDKTVIPTINVQRTLAMMSSWIENSEPFVLVGPEGCGKSMIINHAFRQKKNISITTLHCNAQTTADDVISKIAQTCSLYSSPDGRVYRPRDCERLVLYLKDINLPRPDMYDTCQLIAFLQQLITFEGFYDEALEFLRYERIQIVASINAATTVGRHNLSTRFTAVVRIGVVDYPETHELTAVYSTFLKTVLNSTKLCEDKFRNDGEGSKLALAMVEVYQKTREKFTVDDRRHYLFTPRDLTLWVKNLCRYDLAGEPLIDVVAHEACRIFRDRLVGADAWSRFDQQLNSVLRTHFRVTVTPSELFFSSLTTARGSGSAAAEGSQHDLGGKMHRMGEEDFSKLVSQGIMYYEREERDLNMLLFSEMLEHIAHVDRVLSSSCGHLLMVGRSGVGRRNAATICSYMLGYEFRTLAVSRDYGQKQFGDDIKSALQIAGVKGEHTVLFVEDFQIVSESILEVINSLLSSGEVPGLYTHEELEPILSPLREEMQEDGRFHTPYEFFVSRIRKNLHIVLSMDPGHPQILYRCESNPALYSQCTVLWIGEWRNASLRLIPTLVDEIRDLIGIDDREYDDYESKGGEGKGGESKSMTRAESKLSEGGESGERLIQMILTIHKSCDFQGASPKDYMCFISTWHSLCTLKKYELQQELKHLEAGLGKLDSAAEIVHDLRTNATQQKKDLVIAQQAADKAMDDISKAFDSARERKTEVEEVKRTVAENEELTQARKTEIEEELSSIQPVLESAKQAVGGIRPEHLTEIKSLAAPPEAIADVLAAVLMMLGIQDLSWLSMKKFLSNRGVKEDILNFDIKRISKQLRDKVGKMLKKKANSFDAANIQRVSVAAAPLAAWVKANIRYSIVLEKIEPLNEELAEEVEKLKRSQKRLRKCEEELNELDDKVAALKADFASRTAEAERLKRNLEIAGTTLDKAEGLIGQLSGEQTRWKSQAGQLHQDIAQIPLRMLLAAGFTTYLAKAPEDTRQRMLAEWAEITGVNSFSFKRALSTESELLQWKALGLPADDLSQENGLVIVNCPDRVPFIIDPASVCTEWLKAVLGKDVNRPLEVVANHDKRFSNQVELAVRFGKILLILEADGVEPMLYPLCRKDLSHQGPRYVVNVGDKVVDYNEGFKMLLVTRNPNPELPPDAAALVAQVNFSVTRSGLEGQLLGLAIQHEQPELEKAKGEMLRREEDFKVQLASMEKDLLQTLATAEGNLLENTELIESLSATKAKSAEIEDALKQSAEASIKLDEQREVYRDLAHDGSKLFFLVKSLQSVSHMYQFSLASFLSLFGLTLTDDIKSSSTEERLQLLSADLEIRVLYFIGRALFKVDRPMFALHLIRGMHRNLFQPKEWEIFTGSLVATVQDGVPKGFPSWAASDRVSAFRLLQEQIPHLVHQLELENNGKWQRFSSSVEAERDFPPLRSISSFQKVLVVQAFRPDRLQSAIIYFCCETLRIDSLSPPSMSLGSLHSESTSKSPLLLISSPGADPSKELQEFAEKTVGSGQYEELAMGGGQQDIAMELVRNAADMGSWVCLKNVHLVVSWLPLLEKELSSLEIHSDFRLWLTSESHNSFPSILLQDSLKATYEAPPGVKKNLQRTFDLWGEEVFQDLNPVQARLYFLLACFHAVVQERRNFIPQGWTKFYEFSYGDLKAGTFVMQALAAGNDAIDWKAIYGLMEDAIYGGRVDNVFDLRVLRSYLNSFFSDVIVSEKGAGKEVLPSTPLRMPLNPDFESFKKTINQLPDSDPPYIFGLPDNIERSLQRVTSAAVIKQLAALSTLDAHASKFDREKWRAQLGPILEMWQQLVSTNTGLIEKSRGKSAKASVSSSQNSLDDFVVMENKLANELCMMVDGVLSSLKKILFGSGLLTPAIQIAASSLLAGSTPVEWSSRWEGPEKPQAWISELVRKRMALLKWQSSSTKGTLLEEPRSLGDLFNPATFVNALRQQTARLLNTAIDRVKMICLWETNKSGLRESFSRSGDCPLPCQLTSLLLQGATFSDGMLEDSPSDGTELTHTSDVMIGFVSVDGKDPYASKNFISLPVYHSISREEFLMELKVPVDTDDSKRWVLAGVSLFLSGDE